MWVGKFWYSEMESNGTDQESFGSVIYYLESFGTLSWKVMEPTDLAESFGTRSWKVLEPMWKVLVPWYIIPWSGVPSQGYNMPIYGWCQITWLSGGHGARSIYGLVRKQGELSRQHRHTWAWAEQDCHVSRLPSIKMRPIGWKLKLVLCNILTIYGCFHIILSINFLPYVVRRVKNGFDYKKTNLITNNSIIMDKVASIRSIILKNL